MRILAWLLWSAAEGVGETSASEVLIAIVWAVLAAAGPFLLGRVRHEPVLR
jgi:hypothetical protein